MGSILIPRDVEIRHYHAFCGIGGGAHGFNGGHARVGTATATMRCIGGVDVDAGAVESFTRLVGVPGTVLDLFDRGQYEAFHQRPPPEGWREATADDLRRSAHGERPHIVFLSAPCKGFSGLLNSASAASRKYQALNALTVRGVRLILEAWADDPTELILFENVPRIQTRGRELLDEITGMLRSAGYAVAETTHDCGELGGLAQHRQRFLLVARHREKVGPFLYEPPKRSLQTIGEVIGGLPLPSTTPVHPMHRLPRLQWKTWVRLALIEAGSDWRSLERLVVKDGNLRDIGLMPESEYFQGTYGVKPWDGIASTVTGRSGPTTGAYSVADPRASTQWNGSGKYRVNEFSEPSGAVIAAGTTGNGAFAVADPRPPRDIGNYQPYGVVGWSGVGRTVTSQSAPGTGPYTVADPRLGCDAANRERRRFNNVYRVVRWADHSPAITGGGGPSAGGLAVADPRIALRRDHGFTTGGQAHYGVKEWSSKAGTVTGSARHDNGPNSVADPRGLPDPKGQCTPLIVSLDGTWHRPLTTLELAALQSYPVDLLLTGKSDSRHRGWIGNSVPPDTAKAIASEMAETLLLAWAGQTFQLSHKPIWVQPLSIAVSLDDGVRP